MNVIDAFTIPILLGEKPWLRKQREHAAKELRIEVEIVGNEMESDVKKFSLISRFSCPQLPQNLAGTSIPQLRQFVSVRYFLWRINRGLYKGLKVGVKGDGTRAGRCVGYKYE